MDDIGDNDFLLGFQTQFQKDMMQKFGNNIVCIDTCYNTNIYDFNLVTIVVRDEYGEGIPVAWAVSNRKDTCLLVQLLKCLKERTVPLQPQVFMSDCAEQILEELGCSLWN